MSKGALFAFSGYLLWGFFPIFWKQIADIPAIEIIGHRLVWTPVLLWVVLLVRRHGHWIVKPRVVGLFTFSAVLLSLNWLTFIWAVNNGFIVEASLGYFINPLVNVLIGVVLLGERLSRLQLAAVILAAAGVVYLTVEYGELPWIALALAFSFALYGLIRKKAPLNSLEGLSLEMTILFIPAVVYLIWLEWQGTGSFGHVGEYQTTLLVLTGVITALPLLLFASGARRVSLSTLGILQYTAPTIQFLIGVFLYNEPFNETRLIGYCMIWTALIVYSADGFLHRRSAA